MEKKENKKNKQQLDIELTEEIAQGIYSNLAVITHSPTEFIVDFVRIMPGTPKAKVKSRMILTPEHAKRLAMALNENIKKFEKINGPIKDPQQPPIIPMGFGGPTAQA